MTDTENREFTRVSIHLEKQKFFRKTVNELVCEGLVHENHLKHFSDSDILFDLSYLENKALFALQQWVASMLAGRNYLGFLSREESGIWIPDLAPPRYTDILTFMGYEKVSSKRDKAEFSGRQRELVKELLISLEGKYFFHYYKIERNGKSEFVYGRDFLFGLIPANKPEIFRPSRILVEDLDCYYLSKPTEMYKEADKAWQEMGYKKPSMYPYRVLDWIVLRSFENGYKPLIIGPEQLAKLVGLEKRWNSGKKKEAQNLVEMGLEMAEKMGYVTKISPVGGKKGRCYEIFPNKKVLYPPKKGEGSKEFHYIPTQDELKKYYDDYTY